MQKVKQSNAKIALPFKNTLRILSLTDDSSSLRFFSTATLLNLSYTSKALGDLLSSELYRRKAEQLLMWVVLGEQDKAEALLTITPALLLISAKVIDFSGRTIVGTAFQAALGAGDEPMWTMMLPYFKDLEEGAALRQFNKQFSMIKNDRMSKLAIKEHYDALIVAIINREPHHLSTIRTLCQALFPQRRITCGKHFDLQDLITAYQTYIDKFDDLATLPSRNLFWQEVIGYAHKQLTAYDVQVHCSRITEVLNNPSAFCRSFNTLNNFDSSRIDSACYSYSYEHDISQISWIKALARTAISRIKAYEEKKEKQLQDLEHHLKNYRPTSTINYS